MNKNLLQLIGLGVGVVLIGLLLLWFLFLRNVQHGTITTSTTSIFGTSRPINTTPEPNTGLPTIPSTTPTTPSDTAKRVFKIANGPVSSATFVETTNPTTTMVRYVAADSGHVFDQPIDQVGAVAHSVSGTTVPGIIKALWGAKGTVLVVQYLDNATIKTVYLGLPVATSSPRGGVTIPTEVRFLPNNITSYALSPDGKNITYLLTTPSGVDGYIAQSNGINSKKLFSFPLTQVTVAWPSADSLLLQTKSALAVPGISYSVGVKTGTLAQLVYTTSLSLLASRDFTKLLYQTTGTNGTRLSYIHNLTTGGNIALSYQPLPEKCVWSGVVISFVYCAVPLAYAPANYLNLWHQGLGISKDSVFQYNSATGDSQILVTPDTDGGEATDAANLAESVRGDYLLYTNRTNESLWGVRLSN